MQCYPMLFQFKCNNANRLTYILGVALHQCILVPCLHGANNLVLDETFSLLHFHWDNLLWSILSIEAFDFSQHEEF
jgi:hypothetical protein